MRSSWFATLFNSTSKSLGMRNAICVVFAISIYLSLMDTCSKVVRRRGHLAY